MVSFLYFVQVMLESGRLTEKVEHIERRMVTKTGLIVSFVLCYLLCIICAQVQYVMFLNKLCSVQFKNLCNLKIALHNSQISICIPIYELSSQFRNYITMHTCAI